MNKRLWGLSLLTLSFFLLAMLQPAISQTPEASDIPFPPATPTVAPADGIEGELQQIPILPEVTDHLREIYALGQSLGNDPHVFSKVGDSNTAHPRFLFEIDRDYYDLGPYSYLQETIDWFSGSFGRTSYAAYGGFNFATALDPFLADPTVCEANESPLECEYRVNHTSIAFFMFGSNDLHDLRTERFTTSMRRIIEISLERGVIPVFATFTRHHDHLWDKTMEFNKIVVDVAAEYDVPVINFWLAAQSLPNYGLSEDTMHLTWDKQKLEFNGQETEFGFELRNLLTLQVLDMLRTELPMEE